MGSRRLITAADEVALSLGLHVGMPVSKAPALMPDLQVLLADPAAEAASFERLALWVLHRISPIVTVNAPQAGDRLHRHEDEPVGADCSTSPLCSDSASLRERL